MTVGDMKKMISECLLLIKKNKVPYLLILPSVIVFVGIMFYPLAYGTYLSFFKQTILMPKPAFVGLSNFKSLFSAPFFIGSLKNTLIWSISVVFFTTIVSFSTALILNEQLIGRRLLRTLILLPWIVPSVVAATIWGLILDARYGFLNYLLSQVLNIKAFENFGWLIDTRTSLLSVILVQIWKVFPFFTLAFLAGLQSIPEELYEAAEMDGAFYLDKLVYVTLPSMKPILFTLVLLNVLWTFKAFDIVYVLTKGGPYHSSEVIGIYAWLTSFFYNRPGLGSAVGVIIFIMLLLFAFIYIRHFKEKEQS